MAAHAPHHGQGGWVSVPSARQRCPAEHCQCPACSMLLNGGVHLLVSRHWPLKHGCHTLWAATAGALQLRACMSGCLVGWSLPARSTGPQSASISIGMSSFHTGGRSPGRHLCGQLSQAAVYGQQQASGWWPLIINRCSTHTTSCFCVVLCPPCDPPVI